MRPGNLIFLGARPGMGKSALGVNIAMNVALAGTPAAIFSLEMTNDEVTCRLTSSFSGVALSKLIDPNGPGAEKPTEGDIAKLMEFKRQVDEVGALLELDETSALTLPQLHAKARRLKSKGKLGFLVVDHMHLMKGVGGKSEASRVAEVTEITSGLKSLAKELNIPVLALAQLNRNTESREDKRPRAADLRDSGSAEQDADVIMMLYREEEYVQNQKEDPCSAEYAEWCARLDACRGKAELIFTKVRHGKTGIVDLQYEGPTATFRSMTKAQLAKLANERSAA